ncbi:MAG: branched-chain amino acid ABC transporter substrate-binding protein, partial [Microvirgula sp.]
KLAIIDDRTAYGQGLADEFEKAAKALGADIVKREFTNDKATDFTAILTSIKGVNPDAIFYGGMDAQGGPMARQMQKLGIKSRLIGGDGLQSPVFLQLAGDAAEGQFSTQAGAPKDQQPGYTAFADKLKAKYKQEIQMYATYAYDSAKVLIEAMKEADSVDPAKYLPALAQTQYSGATGDIAFDNKGDRKNAAVTVYQVKGGKWEVVDVVGGSAANAPQKGQ